MIMGESRNTATGSEMLAALRFGYAELSKMGRKRVLFTPATKNGGVMREHGT
jgi:hypothetical protein